jgi:hypothetical protein
MQGLRLSYVHPLKFEAENEIREEARRQEKLKNLKTSDWREGRQRGKSEVMQYIGKKNARHEKVWRPTSGSGAGVGGCVGFPA